MERITTKKAPAAIGPYSQAIETDGYIFTSGQIPINPKSGKIEADTIEGQAEQVMQNLKMGAIETHVADARTCCLHPASTTHRQLTDKQLKEAGIPPDLIRLSIGLEDPDDLIADLKQALAKV